MSSIFVHASLKDKSRNSADAAMTSPESTAWPTLLPIAVAVDAERDAELAADVGDEVRRVEVILDARKTIAVGIDAGQAAHGLAVGYCAGDLALPPGRAG